MQQVRGDEEDERVRRFTMPSLKRLRAEHPIRAIWLGVLWVCIGITALTIFSLVGVFVLGGYLPAVWLCVVAVGFGLSALVPGARWRRQICLVLCAASVVVGVRGFSWLDKNYVHRPEPSLRDARALLQEHKDTLIAAAEAVKPGESFYDGKVLPPDTPKAVRAALKLPIIHHISASKDDGTVNFHLHYTNYFGPDGDYRFLCYVPTDDITLLKPHTDPDLPLVQSDEDVYLYMRQMGEGVEDRDYWYQYDIRLSPRWFYDANDNSREVPSLAMLEAE